LLSWFFDTEDRGYMFLRNVGWLFNGIFHKTVLSVTTAERTSNSTFCKFSLSKAVMWRQMSVLWDQIAPSLPFCLLLRGLWNSFEYLASEFRNFLSLSFFFFLWRHCVSVILELSASSVAVKKSQQAGTKFGGAEAGQKAVSFGF
jgi:hypothetical protein